MIHQLGEQNEIQYDAEGEPIYRCTYPLVQDIEAVNAWELHAGKKDDFYIYGTDAKLARIYPLARIASAPVSQVRRATTI